MKLSIIVPVYNEEKTISTLMQKLFEVNIPHIEKEIIFVDDGSTDHSSQIIKSNIAHTENVFFMQHKSNMGKGEAVRTGIKKATGEYILIQDADLEYDPTYIPKLILPVVEKKAQVVYGTRLKRLPNIKKEEKRLQFLIHYFGNRFLSLVTSILYGRWITDMETCYKLFPRNVLGNMRLISRGFEFEPEITAKLLKQGYKILEVPITTIPRGYDEGKKLNTVRDGIISLWTLLKYKVIN